MSYLFLDLESSKYLLDRNEVLEAGTDCVVLQITGNYLVTGHRISVLIE